MFSLPFSARQRDKIPTLLEELAIAQEEADKLDTMLSTLYLSTQHAGNAETPGMDWLKAV